jgi:putative transposase
MSKLSAPTPTLRPKAHRKTKTPPPPGCGAILRTRFSAAELLRQFHQLLPLTTLKAWLALTNQVFYGRAFTPLITLWYCVFQRLADNHHLSGVVEDARAGGADGLSLPGKALSRQLSSEATTSFSDARQRLPLEIFHNTLWHTAARSASALRTVAWFGLNVALLDGSTCRARPFGDIPEAFPPHRPGNCKTQPYWCVARVLALFCLATGALLDSAMGPLQTSEQALSALLLKRCWNKWLLVADRNFGVYSVVQAARAAQAHLLARLTQARAAKLARLAGLSLVAALDSPLSWCPSRQDQCPEHLERTPVQGRLIVLRLQRPGFRTFTLYLFTTLLDEQIYSAQELAKLYGQRWQVELCLRYVKAQMGLGLLECHSAEMMRKEWLAGLIAYNLIRWTMVAAAAIAQIPVQALSFSRAREMLLGWCLRWSVRRPTLASWKVLLHRIGKARLPQRRKRRPAEPRAIRPFQKDFAKLEGPRALARQKLADATANS